MVTVILIALLVKEFIGLSRQTRIIDQSESYADILRWSEARWQSALDTLEGIVFEKGSSRRKVSYLNSMTLSVSENFLMMRGHDLVSLVNAKTNRVLDKFPGDKLLNHISDSIIPDIKNFAPCDIVETLEALIELGDRENIT